MNLITDNSVSVANSTKSKSDESLLTSKILEFNLDDSEDTTQKTTSSKYEKSSNASTPNEVVVVLNGQILQKPPLPFNNNLSMRGRSATPIRIAFDPFRSRIHLNCFFQRRVQSAPANLRNNLLNQRTTSSFDELISRRARLYISRRPLFDGDSPRNITNDTNDVLAIGRNNIGLRRIQERSTRVRLWQVQQNRAMLRNAPVSVSNPQIYQNEILTNRTNQFLSFNLRRPLRSTIRQSRSNSFHNIQRIPENFPVFRRSVSFIINNNESSEETQSESITQNNAQIEAENNNNSQVNSININNNREVIITNVNNNQVDYTNNNNRNQWLIRCLIS